MPRSEGGHVVGDGVPETPVELRELALPLVLPHALVLAEEREDTAGVKVQYCIFTPEFGILRLVPERRRICSLAEKPNSKT